MSEHFNDESYELKQYSMKTLSRTVWVNDEMRKRIKESASKVLQSYDPYKNNLNLTGLIFELSRFDQPNERSNFNGRGFNDVNVIKTFLNLPSDFFPIHISDDEVNNLIVWGDLDDETVEVLKPRPKVFFTQDSPLFYYDGVQRAKRLYLSEEGYDDLRANYRPRLEVDTIRKLRDLSDYLKKEESSAGEGNSRKTEENS